MRALDEFLFARYSERQILLFHRLFYLSALVYLPVHLRAKTFLYREDLFVPRGIFRVLPLQAPSVHIYWMLYALAGVVFLKAAFKPQPLFRWLAFALCFYLYGCRYNYGQLLQLDSGITIAFGVMALARTDSSWPIRFLGFYWAFILFLCGSQKMAVAGWSWASVDSVANVLWRDRLYRTPTAELSGLSTFIISSGLSRVLSWYTLLLELLAPLMLVHRTLFFVLYPQLLLLLIGIQSTMGRNFIYSMAPLYVAAFFVHLRSCSSQSEIAP